VPTHPTPLRAQVLIESSGISEPLPVAETFTFRDQATGVALNDVASLHNLVTVVDAASVFEQLGTMDTLVDRGWHDVAGDKRTVAHLLCDQLEFANLLLLNKCDLPYICPTSHPHYSCYILAHAPLACRQPLYQVRLGDGGAARRGRGLPAQVQPDG
jgi:hypothetical protein